jgi:hypothetical protein
MTGINDVEKQVYEIVSKFAFIEKVETLQKTPNFCLNFPVENSEIVQCCGYLKI